MIYLEKKDLLNGFVTVKKDNNKQYLYYHIEINKVNMCSRFDLMLCNDKYKYLIMKLNEEHSVSITDTKYIFKGAINNIDDILRQSTNIGIGIYSDDNLIISGYDKNKKINIDSLPIKYELYNSNKNTIKDNNINENLKTSDTHVDNCTEEISLTSISASENKSYKKLKGTIKKTNFKILNNSFKENDENKDSNNIPKNINIIPLDLTINKDTDNAKDIKLLHISEFLNKMYSKATSIRETKDCTNNTISFKINYNNFKRVALSENIYYIPINLIVSMLKKEILKSEKIIITLIFKKNSSYIKYIQIGMVIDIKNIAFKGLSNFKCYIDKEDDLTYLIYNYVV